MAARVLYVSHNGMLENLGQAQVLPYLRGLVKRGFEFDLLSYELPHVSDDAIQTLRRTLRDDGIRWHPMRRAKDPRLRVKIEESARGSWNALKAALERRPAIVHGRSYLPTAVADVVATMLPRTRLVFDCRGMLGDEYVDAGYWTKDRLEYRILKQYERRAFRRAEGVVVLTETLRKMAVDGGWLGRKTHIASIPCCVDLERFRFNPSERRETRLKLGLSDRLVLVYSGSLGSWYEEPQMASFAGHIRRQSRRPVSVLLLTHHDTSELVSQLKSAGFSHNEILVRKVAPPDMAAYLSAGDLAMSFIKSCFSKQGSSPTKVAEYLACGLPVVLNGDIGDQADLAVEHDACVVMPALSEKQLVQAAERALPLAHRSIDERAGIGRRVATQRFGLESVGVPRYEALYRQVLGLAHANAPTLDSRKVHG
jgi:glycosyltransferase involved in cell wall biosynthesis